MKKAPVSIKKQSVSLKDLKTRKNPKGGIGINDTGTSDTISAGRGVLSTGGSNSRR